MAKGKPTPERSKIARSDVKAFARRQRTGADAGPDDDEPATGEKKPETKAADAKPADPRPADARPADAKAEARSDSGKLPDIQPPPPKGEPWPDATPEPMRPVAPAARADSDDDTAPVHTAELTRARTETVVMPTLGSLGTPPEMPRTTAPPPLALGNVENPTHMPGPREIPGGNPEDPAPAPGAVPKGDSRSLRRTADFALIYRIGTYVISRFGRVGTRGQWRVVEYPTSAAASHAYAKECSRFVSEGFSDYRD